VWPRYTTTLHLYSSVTLVTTLRTWRLEVPFPAETDCSVVCQLHGSSRTRPVALMWYRLLFLSRIKRLGRETNHRTHLVPSLGKYGSPFARMRAEKVSWLPESGSAVYDQQHCPCLPWDDCCSGIFSWLGEHKSPWAVLSSLVRRA